MPVEELLKHCKKRGYLVVGGIVCLYGILSIHKWIDLGGGGCRRFDLRKRHLAKVQDGSLPVIIK